MQDHGIWFPASQHNRIDSILLQPTNVCHPLRTYWSLVHNIYLTNYAVNIGFYFVTNSMLVEVLEDIGFQLQLGRLTKKILTPSNLERRYARDRAVRPRSSSPMIATLIRPKDARDKSYTSRGGLAWVLAAHAVIAIAYVASF